MNDDIRTQRVNAAPPPVPDPSDEKTRRVGNTHAPEAVEQSDQDDIGTRRVNGQNAVPPTVSEQADIATRHVGGGAASSASTPSHTGRLTPLGFLAPGTTICGDCIVIETHHNHESARPGLYICDAPQGRVMVKVAATDFPPQRDLWDKLPDLRHPHVLQTYRVMQDTHFFEVQEFCSAGTLTERVPTPGSGRATPPIEWIEKAVVPSFQSGIAYLHQNDVVHRDIKPSNLYLREQNGKKVIVIGDFDISSVLQTGRTSRSTERAAGTWNYSPPEAFPRFIDEEASRTGGAVTRSSDYYSFGVVLVELLLGTTSLHQAQLPDLYDFYLQGGRVAVPDGLPDRLSELLHGLLLRNRHLRWGGEEVGRWLKEETSEADRKRIRDDSGYQLGRSAQPFTAFDHARPTNLTELANAMAKESEVARDELMSGDVMLNWIGNIDARVAREIRRDRETWRTQPEVALLCATLRCDATQPLAIAPDFTASDAQGWAHQAQAAVEANAITPIKIFGANGFQCLETWLRLKADPEPEMAERVASLRTQWANIAAADSKKNAEFQNKAAHDANIALEEVGYAFLPDKPYAIAPDVSGRTPKEIAQLTYGRAEDWEKGCTPTYATARERWQNGHLQAWLRQRLKDSPLVAQCEGLHKQFADEPAAGFETTLRLLDPELPPVRVKLDDGSISHGVLATYGDDVTRTVSYETIGPGIPFGALHLEDALPGLQLGEHQLRKRQGKFEVRLESRNEIPVSRPFQARIKLESQFTRMEGNELVVPYGVTFPTQKTLLQVAAGAALGALLLGGARLIISGMLPRPVTTRGLDTMWDSTIKGDLSSGSLIIAAFVIGGFAYAGFKIWMWALKNHASG